MHAADAQLLVGDHRRYVAYEALSIVGENAHGHREDVPRIDAPLHVYQALRLVLVAHTWTVGAMDRDAAPPRDESGDGVAWYRVAATRHSREKVAHPIDTDSTCSLRGRGQ